MITGDESKAQRIGLVTHGLLMGTVVFGLVYAALFVLLDDTSLLAGVLIGIGHGIVAGLAMVMMGTMHPWTDPPPAGGSDEAVIRTDRETRPPSVARGQHMVLEELAQVGLEPLPVGVPLADVLDSRVLLVDDLVAE